jgi:hypothetical protein
MDESKARCPRCDSSCQSLIVYGFVEMTDDLRERLSSGTVALRGCEIRRHNPEWLCRDCGNRWGRSTQSRAIIKREIALTRTRKAKQAKQVTRRGWLGRLLLSPEVSRNAPHNDDPLWDQTLDT